MCVCRGRACVATNNKNLNHRVLVSNFFLYLDIMNILSASYAQMNWTLVNCQLLPVDEGTPWPCNTSGECPTGHCCVSVTRPRGKRQITNGYSGYCHPLGQLSHGKNISDDH